MNSDLSERNDSIGQFNAIDIEKVLSVTNAFGNTALHRTNEYQIRLTSTSNDLLQKTPRAEKRKELSKTSQDY